MKIRLDQVDEPFDWQETLVLTAAEKNRPDLVEISEVECRGRVSSIVEGFLLQADLSYEQTLRCVRCLSPVSDSVSTRLELLLQVGGSEASSGQPPEEERQLEQEELGLLVVREPHIETQPMIVEQVQLGVPMKVLCKDDCAGLCVSCGGDLNDGPCGCEQVVDSRWGALAGLKKELPD